MRRLRYKIQDLIDRDLSLESIARNMTRARASMLVDIADHEPAPGLYTGVHRRVWGWLYGEGLIAMTCGDTVLIATPEGHAIADSIRAVRMRNGKVI